MMSDKAQLILDTAERLFADGRYHEVTLDHLCKEAGIGKGTVYRYFEDKEDLYYKVILRGLDELMATVQQVAESTEEPGEGLRETARRMVEFYNRRHALFSLMWSEQLRGSEKRDVVRRKWRRKSDKIVDIFAGFIRTGVDRHCYRIGKFSPAAAARLLMGMLRTGMRHRNEMPGGKDWPVGIVEMFETGLLADDAKEAR